MPSPGWPERVEVRLRLHAPHADVRENLQTGTLALTTGFRPAPPTRSARLPPQQTDAELTDRVDLLPATDDLDVLPPSVRNLAADLVEGIDPGWAQVAAVRDSFRTTGFYDSDADVPPGHSYFRLSEFLADPDRIVGYEEQYAAAAGGHLPRRGCRREWSSATWSAPTAMPAGPPRCVPATSPRGSRCSSTAPAGCRST